MYSIHSKVLHGPPLPFGLIFSNPLLLSHIALLAALCTLQACSCLGAFASTVSSTWSTLSHTTSLPQLLCVSTQILPERGLSSEFHWNLLLCFFFTDLVTIYSFSFTPYVQFLSVMLLCHSLGQLSLSAWLQLLLVQPWKEKGGRVPRNTGSCVLLQFLWEEAGDWATAELRALGSAVFLDKYGPAFSITRQGEDIFDGQLVIIFHNWFKKLKNHL